MKSCCQVSLIAAFATLLGAPTSRAQVLLHRSFPAGAGACAVATGDFNGDKKLDVVFVERSGIAVAMGNGDGTLNPPIHTASPFFLCSLVTGDFNRDGKLDVVTGAGFFFAGKGDGTFEAAAIIGVAGLVAAEDFDRDGKLDLVVAKVCAQCGAVLLMGNGDGTFRQPESLLSGGEAFGVVTGDFNGDGAADVVVGMYDYTGARFDGTRVQVRLGDGRGGFAEARNLSGGDPDAAFGMAAADLNGDGKTDLVFSTSYNSTVMLGRADGDMVETRIGNYGSTAVVIGDFDGDGNPDILAGSEFEWFVDFNFGPRRNLVWYRGRGDGTFAYRYVNSIAGPAALAAGDFLGDGATQAIGASPIVNELSIFRRADAEPPSQVVSTAHGTDLVAAGSAASVYGAGFSGRGQAAGSVVLPTELAGARADVLDSDGARVEVGLYAVFPQQIDFRIPETAPAGAAKLIVHTAAGADVTADFQIQRIAPSLFLVNSRATSLAPAGVAVRLEAGGAQTELALSKCAASFLEFTCTPLPVILDDRPVYLVLYGTGFANRSSLDAVRCVIGGVTLPVEYAGPSGIPGMDQVNVRLTPSARSANAVRLTLVVDGLPSNSVDVAIR